MSVVLVNSKNELRKVLDNIDELALSKFFIISNIIKRKNFPKEAFVFKYTNFIPNANALNKYLTYGDEEEYYNDYIREISHPTNILLMANMLAGANNFDIFLVRAEDEEPYLYTNMLRTYIESNFDIEVISSKKFCKGKESDYSEDFDEKVKNTTRLATRKLEDCAMNPECIIARTFYKKDFKHYPDSIKEIYKDYKEFMCD